MIYATLFVPIVRFPSFCVATLSLLTLIFVGSPLSAPLPRSHQLVEKVSLLRVVLEVFDTDVPAERASLDCAVSLGHR